MPAVTPLDNIAVNVSPVVVPAVVVKAVPNNAADNVNVDVPSVAIMK
jgi:hypothetical protein